MNALHMTARCANASEADFGHAREGEMASSSLIQRTRVSDIMFGFAADIGATSRLSYEVNPALSRHAHLPMRAMVDAPSFLEGAEAAPLLQ